MSTIGSSNAPTSLARTFGFAHRKIEPKYGLVRAAVGSSTGGTDDLIQSKLGTPNAGIFILPHAVTNATSRNNAGGAVGLTDFKTEGLVGYWHEEGSDNPVVSNHYHNAGDSLAVIESSVQAAANASKIINGARLTWSSNGAAADFLCTALMFSGVNAKQGTIDPGSLSADSAFNITDVGFEPDIVFLLDGESDASSSVVANTNIGFGVAVNGGNQLSIVAADQDGGTGTSAGGAAYNNRAAINITVSSMAVASTLEVTAFASNGFTITARTGTWSNEIQYLALKLRGKRVACGEVNTPTATGNFDITGLSFQPRFVLQLLTARTAFNSGNFSGHNFSLGAFDGTSEFVNDTTVIDLTGAGAGYSLSEDKASSLRLFGGGPLLSADFVSMLSNGFRLNYTDVEVVSYKGFYVAFE